MTVQDDAAASIESVRALRELVGSYATSTDLSRVLIAQCNHAERLIMDELFEEAQVSLLTIRAGLRAAGPMAWKARLR